MQLSLLITRKKFWEWKKVYWIIDEDLSEFHAAMSDANHHDDDSIMGNSIQQDLDYDSSEEMGGKGKSRTDITVNTPTMSEFLVHNMSVWRIIMDMLFFI